MSVLLQKDRSKRGEKRSASQSKLAIPSIAEPYSATEFLRMTGAHYLIPHVVVKKLMSGKVMQ